MLNIFKQLVEQLLDPEQLIQKRYVTFKGMLNSDRQGHRLLAELESIYYSGAAIDISRLRLLFDDFSAAVQAMIDSLHDLAPGKYRNLADYYKKIDFYARFALAPPRLNEAPPFVLPLERMYGDDLLVGGKGLHLTELKEYLGLPVPEGFILSTSAWNYFVSENDLRDAINRELAEVDIGSVVSLQTASARLIELIEQSPLPYQIQDEISNAVSAIAPKMGSLCFAVRSSAVAEDSELSFAGQYLSLLDVTAEEIGSAYRQVLSSKYTPEAMLYRIINGLDDEAVPMAVLVLEMVRAETSGVALTSREARKDVLSVRIHGVRGLGDKLMAGEVIPEITELGITDETSSVEIYPQSDSSLCLSKQHLMQLGNYVNTIDSHYRTPQEVEWSCDRDGNLYLLQTRRLNPPVIAMGENDSLELPDLPLLFSSGETGAPGIGSGSVLPLYETGVLPEVPDGTILVCRVTPPSLVTLLPSLSGVIAEFGSAADHFSSVAREFGVPVLLQVGKDLDELRAGDEILLHADNCQVFQGRVSLPENYRIRKQLDPESSVGRVLKMVIGFTSPLSLLNPTARDFTPENCRSLHDIIRFVHEKGVQEMFLHNPDSFFRKPKTVQLASNIPLQVYLIDVGGGLRGERKDLRLAVPDDILSRPLSALWKGLSHPNINWRDRNHFDWASYDAVVLAGGIAGKGDSELASYCLLSREYANISMRFGYHFTLIDCFCGESPEENYILIRFAGGGGTDTGKDLRLIFITTILERLGFTCERSGEMIDARLMRYDSETTACRMEQVGHLLGSVRLLDMILRDEREVGPMVERFFDGIYDFSNE